jgi:hypothetical protein
MVLTTEALTFAVSIAAVCEEAKESNLGFISFSPPTVAIFVRLFKAGKSFWTHAVKSILGLFIFGLLELLSPEYNSAVILALIDPLSGPRPCLQQSAGEAVSFGVASAGDSLQEDSESVFLVRLTREG